MERLLLLDADYTITNSKPIIRLYCSDENGKTTVLLDDSFEPYFYVLPKQGKELEVKKRIENLKRSEIKKVELVERKLLGEKKKFLKITCDLPSNVPKVRDVIKEWEDGAVIEEYEYALSFYKRYLIDKQLSGIQWIEVDGEEVKGNYQAEKVLKLKKLKVLEDLELPKLKILAFDIETVEEGGKQKIIMLSLVGDSFKKVLTYQKDSYPNYVEVVRDEKELLERFVEVVNEQDVDILLGYNCLPYDEQIILENGNRMSIGEYVKKYEKSEHRPKVIGMVNGYMCPVEVTGVWKYIHPTHHKIIKIRTQTGTELSVTPGNKLPVGTTKGIEWKYAKHVQPSDLIATPRVIKVRVTTPKFIDFIRDDRLVTDRIFIGWVKKCLLKKFGKYRNVAEKLHMNVNTLKNCRGFKIKFLKEHILQILGYEWDEIKEKIKEVDRIKLPEIDKGLMYVAGLVASDGSVSDGNHNRVSFGNTDKRLTDEFKRIVEMKFRKSVEERIIYLHSPKHKDRIQVRVSCSLLRDFLTSLGIPSGNKTKKGVELMRLFTFSEELIGAFIAGLVDGDGNVHGEKQKQRTFYIENKNRKTKSWVKKLLLRLGIVGSLHSQGIYLIRCSDNIQRIKQFILPMMKKNEKVECFLSSIKTDKRGNLDILPPLAGKLLKKIRKKKNISTYSFKNTPHSTIYYYESGMYKIQRDKFLEIVEELKNRFCINVKELEEISNSEIFWDKVVKVEESETSSVYDLTTSSGNFVANDVIVHNSDMFDFQILQQRADELKVKLFLSRDGSYLKFARRARISAARLSGRVHIDIFNFINNVLSPTLQTETLTLDAVSAELLGDEKIEMEFEEILKAWRKKRDLAKLAEYCLKDSELTLRLSKLLLPQIFEICKIVGQLPFDVSRMTYGQLVEWYLTKKAFTLNEIILNQPKFEEIQKRRLTTYVGGFVKEPIGGIHENIAVVDFRSLYPSIIATFNISPETIDCEHVECKKEKIPESNHWFCKKKKGFFSVVVKELIEKRIEVKEKMKKLREGTEGYKKFFNQQYALKILANATYGYTGYPGSKWYSKKCAESITAYGRYFVKKIIELAEKSGFTVVYADTDSCFIKL